MIDDFLTSKTPKIYKSKKLNQANFGDFNHSDYQIFLLLVSKLGGVDKNGKYLQPQDLQREHLLKAKDLHETFNLDLRNSYVKLRNTCKKLMKTSVIIEFKDSEKTREINVCSMAEYNPKEGSISIKFTDDIMPYLSQVKEKFLLYNLKEIAGFRSLYTTRLYELLQEFKETGWMLKSIDQLRNALGVNKDSLRIYNNFKRKAIIHACNEINEEYNFNLRFEEIKEGRKVIAIKFIFKPIAILNVTNEAAGKTRKFFTKHEMNIKAPQKQRSKKAKEPILIEEQKDALVFRNENHQKNGGLFSSFMNFFRKK
ncbi:replication initiation protein [Flavobacterium sp.]|uniref:replication initiation protein n=1 Tax=Flavobacterium sp. TaxID=239 RepID=UPI00262267DA|nr:replication initiation protein [Flavobacterium sp.]MDD3005854.1 replication initiation protein [Flavobacterium sp.]